jgi:phosphoglycerol transferase MdoB-like AlkP superfamily enzyme
MPTRKDIALGLKAALVPTPTLAFLAVLGLYALEQVAFLAVVSWKHEFRLADPLVLLTFCEKFVFDFALYFAIAAALLRLTRRAWPAFLFSVLYFGVMTADTLVYTFSSSLLELQHLSLIEGYSLAGFVTWSTVGFVAGFAALLVALLLALRELRSRATWPSAARFALLALALGLAKIPARAAQINKADERYDKVIMVFRNAQLEYAAQNPLAAFANDIVMRAVSEELYTVRGSATYRKYMKEYDFTSSEARVERDSAKHAKAIRELKLPIGERRYPDVGLGEIRRVIVVFAESFSADLLKCENPMLPVDATPNLCSPRFHDRMFSNLTTSGTPTLEGMTTAFSSHRNYDVQKPTGYRNMLTKLVKEHGFKTLLMRSASRFFADENLVFKKWGFDRIVAREDFYEREELRPYIYGWGLEDRILLDEAVAELERRKSEKTFLTLLGTDMHPLHGQCCFKGLEYPPLPGDFKAAFRGASKFMRATHNVDFDLARFVDELTKRGLLGDDALLFILADHSCPPNAVTMRIPGHTREPLGRIPFVVLAPGAKGLKYERGRLASQIDVAPTIAHLMGLPIPRGWWGESLFATEKKNPAIGFSNGMMQLRMPDGGSRLYNLKKRDTVPDDIAELFTTVFVE